MARGITAETYARVTGAVKPDTAALEAVRDAGVTLLARLRPGS